MDKKTQIAVVTGTTLLVVLLLGLAVWSSKSTTPVSDIATSTVATTTISKESSSSNSTGLPDAALIPKNSTNGLSVADQVTGEFVAVTDLHITENTWVTVYDEVNGQPGRVMGAWLELGASASPKTIVPLLKRKTLSGQRYYVALIKDVGNKEFDIATDRPTADTPVVSFLAK